VRYRITGADGRQLEVDAVDWMMAMCHAINRLGIEVSGWMCDTRPGGDVHVADPVHGHSWVVHKLEELPGAVAPVAPSAGPPPPPPGALDSSQVKTGPPPVRPSSPPGRIPAPTIPPQPMPAEPEPEPGPPDDLAERLFDLSMDVSGAGNPNEACRQALAVALELVPCEAGSVVRGAINDAALTFVAASGPAADQMIGQKLPFGKGLIGAAFDLGITIQVNDVAGDPRHAAAFDRATGFRTRGVLCVPVRTETEFYGAIELLNPPSRFMAWHVEVAETVARTLASTLSGTL